MALLRLALALAGHAGATEALPVHTLVLAEPRDAEAGRLAAERVGIVLVGAGGARLIDPLFAEARLGRGPAEALAECAGREACWQEVGAKVGAERIVWVEQIDAQHLGVLALDVQAGAGFRRESAALLPGGWPDPRLVERLVFGEGALAFGRLPPRASVVVDGALRPAPGGGEALVVGGLYAGKHAVEITAPGYATWHAAVMVPAGGARALEVDMVPAAPAVGRPRWWAGAAVAVAGGLAWGLASRAEGVAGAP